MSTIELSQTEADALFKMKKIRLNVEHHEYPNRGGSLRIPLVSKNKRETFMLDITRGRIDLSQGTLQNRARQVFILARLDYNGPPHINPDGTEIPCPHLHLYREGYGDKWAVSVPAEYFKLINDRWETLQDFMKFCNITKKPIITKESF